MKIGFDAKRLFLNNTGLGNYSRTLVRNLNEYYPDHQYFLYTPRIVENESTSYFLDKDRFILREAGIWPSYWRRRGMVKDLLSDGIDIYHGLSHEIPSGIKHTGIKTCVSIHDLIFEVYPSQFNFIDRKIYQYKYNRSARSADRVIAISNSTSIDIQEYWGIEDEKIDIVYQSAGPEFFNSPLESNKVGSHFLYVGSIIERKRLLDIIKAYGMLSREREMPPFKVIGKGKGYYDKCRAEIGRLGLDSKFEFIGQVENARLINFYDNAIALIYPSVYEGFGIPIIEAMLRKVPVICSSISSMPEAGGSDSLYIEPGNLDNIASAMKYCLDNPRDVEFRSEKSYLYATERFKAERTAHSLISIYRKLIK